MERRINGVVVFAVALVIILENGVFVNAQVYACTGGCYNNCFLRSNKTGSEMLACYYQCLNTCVPRSAADYQYYCQIGCSLVRCIPATNDGGKLEKCFGQCNKSCKS